MQVKDEANKTKRYFDNVAEYYTWSLGPTDMLESRMQSIGNTASFAGSDSLDETKERYTKGYRKGLDKARELSMKLTPFLRTVKGMKRGYKPQRYAGGNFLLDNYCKGIPEVCNVVSPVESKKFASIILNGTASCGVQPPVMEKRGVAVLALVDILQLHGYRVAVRLAYAVSGHDGYYLQHMVNLKAFEQTVEMDRLAFFLSDPSAFRRLQFATMEREKSNVRTKIDIGGSYGTPKEIEKEDIGEKDIYIGCASWHLPAWRDLEDTKKWLVETLRRYGVEFHG